jgi:uncharacterized membrane protein (DUF373 family)
MAPKESSNARWRAFLDYMQFERIALACVLLMIGAIAIYAIVIAATKLGADMLAGEAVLDRTMLQDTLGSILIILILLEFNHSVWVALTERSGAIQARILVRITILVIVRKLMLMDFTAASAETMLGFAALLLALGGLYWLISDGDRRQQGLTPNALADE